MCVCVCVFVCVQVLMWFLWGNVKNDFIIMFIYMHVDIHKYTRIWLCMHLNVYNSKKLFFIFT